MDDVSTGLVKELLAEKRADRRWKNIRFVAWFALILFFISLFYRDNKPSAPSLSDRYISLIRLDGMIAPGTDFSAEEVIPLLEQAFSDKNAKGVILEINSGGGTPVQSSIIHDAIIALKNKYHKRVIVVGEDMLTSGAYYVAVAGDKIYVNPNTLTGSIGVIMKGFGFAGLMQKVGVERRVYTSGADKDRLDPFLPQSEKDIAKINQVIDEVHQNFNQVVLEDRKGRLHADPATLFTGDFWSGQTAVKLGLVDGLGNLYDVGLKEFGTSHYKEYQTTNNFVKMLTGQVNTAWEGVLEAASVRLG